MDISHKTKLDKIRVIPKRTAMFPAPIFKGKKRKSDDGIKKMFIFATY